MSEKVQVRRRGEKVTAIRVQAATPFDAISKILESGVTKNWSWRDKENMAQNLQAEIAGWWIVRPRT
jgi:hypothetical protein